MIRVQMLTLPRPNQFHKSSLADWTPDSPPVTSRCEFCPDLALAAYADQGINRERG